MTSRAAETASRRRLIGQARAFDRLVERAEQALAAGLAPRAAALCHKAAVMAWHSHTGRFASPRLEAVLRAIAAQALPPAAGRPAGRPQRILHVMTQAAAVGGHTRLAWRWIRQDAGRLHHVALIDQGPIEVPAWLDEAVETVRRLDREAKDPIGRAAALRAMASGYDLVVLHAHPHDIVPVMAFADPQRPPTVCMNHADHVFWLGVSVADVVACFRRRGIALCVDRRGVAPERCAIVPIPVDEARRTLSRSEARRALGLPEDATVLLTVATAYKYNPVLGSPDFVETVTPILQAHRNARLVAVGPSPTGAWKRGAAATDGRLQALGERGDLPAFYQAADVYLESFPLGSFTALLEAGSYGLPLVGLLWQPGTARQMASDNPGLESTYLAPERVPDYRKAVERLIVSPEEREALGAQTAERIRAAHGAEAWGEALERLYALAAGIAPVAAPAPHDPPPLQSEHDRFLEFLFRQQKRQMLREAITRPSLAQIKLMWNRLRMYYA